MFVLARITYFHQRATALRQLSNADQIVCDSSRSICERSSAQRAANSGMNTESALVGLRPYERNVLCSVVAAHSEPALDVSDFSR